MRRFLVCRYICFVLALTAFGGWGCSEARNSPDSLAQNTPAVQHLSVEEVYQILQSQPDAMVIDVRTQEEFSGPLGHIAGAHLKPVQEMQTWASQIDSLKDEQIILICRTVNRSGKAAEYLRSRGFTNLVAVQGGMVEWNNKGYPVEK